MADEFEPIAALTDEQIEAAAAEFRSIDADGNGQLDEAELRRYLSSPRAGRAELRSFPKLIIHFFGSDGTVTFEQFLAFFKSLTAPTSSDEFLGRKIFDKIDLDHNGVIDQQEYSRVLDLIESPGGQLKRPDLVDMNYETFRKEFFVVLKMVWKSSGFR